MWWLLFQTQMQPLEYKILEKDSQFGLEPNTGLSGRGLQHRVGNATLTITW